MLRRRTYGYALEAYDFQVTAGPYEYILGAYCTVWNREERSLLPLEYFLCARDVYV